MLTLHDTKDTEWTDLATNFYLSPSDIGKNRCANYNIFLIVRAECSIKKISELNPYVKTNLSTIDLSKDFSVLNNYKVYIFSFFLIEVCYFDRCSFKPPNSGQ